MALLLFYFSLAILVSFLCSILEAVLLSLTPSYVSAARQTGARTGKILHSLREDIDRPLAAILSLNTIAHTVGAAGVGAQAQVVFSNVPLSVISGVLTLLILVFSEIIPKTIGAEYWRSLAVPCAFLTHFLTRLMAPLVLLSRTFSRLLTRQKSGPSVSREEIEAITDLGHQEGTLDTGDTRMLQSVLRFQAIKVSEVYTPRTVVHHMEADRTVRRIIDQQETLTFSRYPVLKDAEQVLGYVLKNDILMAAAKDQWDTTMEALAQKVLILPESIPIKRAFARFMRHRSHMAVVVDEFGSFSGVLTLEDVVETLIGHEIMDEGDEVEDLREFARQNARNTVPPEAGSP